MGKTKIIVVCLFSCGENEATVAQFFVPFSKINTFHNTETAE